MSDNRLIGAIPAELGDLTGMIDLRLAGNRLIGCIPDGLRDIQNNDLARLGLPSCSNAGPSGVEAVSSDRDTLIALYNSTDGPNWANNENWLSDTPIRYWHGVRADGNGRVTQLDLDANGLTGEIPSELGNLANLGVLRLGGNQLSGAIPPELGNLTNLLGLYLWDNQLTGTIPAELGDLTGMIDLRLAGNRLIGCIPDGLRDIQNSDLAWLGLPSCSNAGKTGVEEISPDRDILIALYNSTDGPNWANSKNWLSDTPIRCWHGVRADENGRVTQLDLDSNGLTGEIPPELGNLANLGVLRLGGNALSGAIPPELGNLTILRNLNIWGNQLRGEIPTELGDLVNLRYLSLGGNQLSGQIPPELGNLANLETLGIGLNALTGPIPSELGNPVALWSLSLSGNQLTGQIPTELAELPNLNSIWLAGNPLSGCVPERLLDVLDNDLDRLGLPSCLNTRPTGVDPVSPDRDILIAFYNSTDGPNWTNGENWLSDAPLRDWHGITVDGYGRVTTLTLYENGLTGEIPPELGGLSELKLLYLWNNQLSGKLPPELGNLANLTGLAIQANRLNGELPAELGNLASLESLHLWGNRLIGQIPTELAELPNLNSLWLLDNRFSGCIPDRVARCSGQRPRPAKLAILLERSGQHLRPAGASAVPLQATADNVGASASETKQTERAKRAQSPINSQAMRQKARRGNHKPSAFLRVSAPPRQIPPQLC